MDLALNNLQWLICHKTKPNQTKPNQTKLSSFFSMRFVNVYAKHPYSSIDTIAAWKKTRFISSDRSDFDMIDSLPIAVHAFGRRRSTSLSISSDM